MSEHERATLTVARSSPTLVSHNVSHSVSHAVLLVPPPWHHYGLENSLLAARRHIDAISIAHDQ